MMVKPTLIIESADALSLLSTYPEPVKTRLLSLRKLIFETATECSDVNKVEETLKWNEPAYITKHGSTLRLNRVKSQAEQYALYFHCKSKLVDTFKEVYQDIFIYEGNRAIIFNINQEIPLKPLKQCIALSLGYHKEKPLPLLGL